MSDTEKRILKLGKTDGYRYIGFQPPLSKEEIDGIPLPTTDAGDNADFRWRPTSIKTHPDGTMDIGFLDTPFDIGDPLETYATHLARHLGNCVLDPSIRHIGPGSVIGQANGVPAAY